VHRLHALVVTLSCVLIPHALRAAPPSPDVRSELSVIETTEQGLDPLGIDQVVGRDLDQAAARLKPPTKPAPPLRVGPVLTAIEPVRELSHSQSLRWQQGLMHGTAEIVLGSESELPAAVAYRLPLAAGSVVTRVAACVADQCSDASPRHDASTEAPAAGADRPGIQADPITDARGNALALRAYPVQAAHPLRVIVQYVAPAEAHGGVASFGLPARGEDPRISVPTLRLSAPAYVDFSATLDPDAERVSVPYDDSVAPLKLRGILRAETPRGVRRESAPCGRGLCTRSYLASAFHPEKPRETWIWLDASPSMEGLPRNRADRVLTALLASLPEETPLSATGFAARHRRLAQGNVASTSLRTLSDGLTDDLGASTQLHVLVHGSLPDIKRQRPRLVVVSDGAFDPADHALDALASTSAHGADPWLVHVGKGPPPSAGRVQVLDLGSAEALDDAAFGDVLRTLEAAGQHSQRSGEGLVAEHGPRSLGLPPAGAHWLWFWLRRHSEPLRFTLRGTLSEATRNALLDAPPYVPTVRPEGAALTGMPKESVLSMLRTQLVPRARACLRQDRAGRADYAVELIFEAEFAAREAYDVRVLGQVPTALSRCLLAIFPDLRVPAFTGRVRVHYPIHTERELPAEATELSLDEADSVKRALSTHLGAPRH
jgi:hypothetical protein